MVVDIIAWFLFIHWVADFVLQTDQMAQNKSKDNRWLALHCIVYGACFSIGTLNILYGVLLGALHFPVDYVTSRINSKLYSKGDIHNFFVSVGFDQLIHMLIIVYTFHMSNIPIRGVF